MFDLDKCVSVMERAAALGGQYLLEAMSSIENQELDKLRSDLERLEDQGVWSSRIIEIMRRARLIFEADQMLERMEAA